MASPSELLGARRGSVVAPAGCGKTELIAQAIAAAPSDERHLVLTHTHAGVGALRSRLRRMKVAPQRYQVDTIAGFCLRYGAAYPSMSGLGDITPSGGAWNDVYPAALQLLDSSIGRTVLDSSYSSAFVDEYQDCSPEQHDIVRRVAVVLPTRVLGDPLQSIFNFNGAPVPWNVVEQDFTPLAGLTTPWRWRNVNDQLGEWLLSVRAPLLAKAPVTIDDDAPVTRCIPDAAMERLRELGRTRQSVVAIRKWEVETHEVARELDGSYSAIETVDCKDLSEICRHLDLPDRRSALAKLLDLLRRSTTGHTAFITALIDRLEKGERSDLDGWPEFREALRRYYTQGEAEAVGAIVTVFCSHSSVRPFRKELLAEVASAATAVAHGECSSFGDAAWHVRDQTRKVGRRPELRLISRTLLVKGLEFEHSAILHPSELTANDLYVALTRGSRSVTVVMNPNSTDLVYDGCRPAP